MKKIYMVLAALLIGSVCFAQLGNRPTAIKAINSVSAERSGFIGNMGTGTVVQASNGDELAIAPRQFDANISGNITKIKFYRTTNGAPSQYPNTSYTLSIYNNINLGGDYAAYGYYDENSCGQAAYSQNFTVSTEGWAEVELTTPYQITAGEFWVSVKANGTSLFAYGGEASAVEGQYYVKTPLGTNGTFWMAPEFGSQGSSESTLFSGALAVYVDDGAAEEVVSDMEARLFGGMSGGFLTAAPASYTIGTAEDLVIYPFFANNGPSPATSGTVTCMVKVGGETVDTQAMELSEEESLSVGGTSWSSPYQNGSFTITAAMMDAINGLGATFDVCFEVVYSGNDNVAANNSYCIPVTRTNATSDLEAKAFTDAQLTSPMPATMTLLPTDDFQVYPAVKNNGPDAAAGTVSINVSMDGQSIPYNTMNLASSPLQNGETRAISAQGFGFSAALMDQYELTGTFEICFSIESATDHNDANNEVCVTITRQSATSVEENIAASVSVYPNPANDMFTVANAEGATIVVVNSLGQVVANIENAAANQTIDASNFANGTYFVKVNAEVIKINVIK